ncbi:MAG: NADH-quinone oxidoreductase subunit J family protein [Candidatus Acidiferrales bacterium]
MTAQMIVFFLFAAIAVAGAIAVILAREPIHSALSLILVMVSLAVIYLLLGAAFISAVQIIVYAGAIMVLFVFVIMLLNAGVEERTNVSHLARFVGLPLGIFLMIELAWWLGGAGKSLEATRSAIPASTRELSSLLFRSYLFPFEATSILILIALLGAVVLAKRDS